MRWLLALSVVALAACSTPMNAPSPQQQPTQARWHAASPSIAPSIQREFRAAWVATVANIDWPSKPGLDVPQMKAEIKAHVQAARSIGLNALLVQVRTNADALYVSALEPWAEWLTGAQGQAPIHEGKVFDPLQEWIEQGHAAGIEIHAWFNPYRAAHTAAKSAPAATHVSQTQPKWFKRYGGFGWLDPGEPEAAAHSLAVMHDVTQRYDIDGLHIDDYFYPYPVNTTTTTAGGTMSVRVPFPDEPSWQAYRAASPQSTLSRDDWRRVQVNQFVQRMDEQTRAAKPWVRVGISPFGLGKPALRPEGIRGFSQYDELYADVELWQERGWLDYLAPQLYWSVAQKAQAFDVLLDYWIAKNTAQRHVFAGLYSSRINNTTATWQPSEITTQIELARARASKAPQASGHVHFSMIALTQNRLGLADALRAAYAQPAIAPVHPRVPAEVPTASATCTVRDRWIITMGRGVRWWHVWRSDRDSVNWTHQRSRMTGQSDPTDTRFGGDLFMFDMGARTKAWVIRAEDAYGRVTDVCAGEERS